MKFIIDLMQLLNYSCWSFKNSSVYKNVSKAKQFGNKEPKGLEQSENISHKSDEWCRETSWKMVRGIISQRGDRGCSPTGFIYTADS